MHDKRLEFICALQALAWGLWIGNPFWATFGVSTAYLWMGRLMPEWAWGLFLGVLGAAQLGAALWGHSIRLRTATAAAGTLGWVLVAIATVLGNWRSVATVMYTFLALTELLVYIDGATVWLRKRRESEQDAE